MQVNTEHLKRNLCEPPSPIWVICTTFVFPLLFLQFCMARSLMDFNPGRLCWDSTEKPSPSAVPIGTGTHQRHVAIKNVQLPFGDLCAVFIWQLTLEFSCALPCWYCSSHFSAFQRFNLPVALSLKALSKLLSSLYSSISTAAFHKTPL